MMTSTIQVENTVPFAEFYTKEPLFSSSQQEIPEDCGEEFPSSRKQPQFPKAKAKTPFPFDVQPLSFVDKSPEDYFSFYNPSIIGSLNNSMYYVAVREASFNYCPGHENNRSQFFSRIHLGITDDPRGPAKYCGTFTEGSRRRVFKGPQDPRLVYIAPHGSNGTKSLHMIFFNDYTIHLSQVHFSVSGNDCSVKVTNRLRLWVNESQRRQKNWMFIPDRTTPDGEPLFAYKLNPLQVLRVNMTTGEGIVISSQPSLKCVPGLRGSSMLLHHPTQPNVFIGIAHEQLRERRYYSRVISIKEYEPQKYQLIGMSDRFGIPPNNEDICVEKIHFIPSILYGDKTNKTIILTMGYMDCTIHTVQVQTTDLLSSIKPIQCS